MCKFSSPLPLAQGQLNKMGLIGIMGALAAWLLLKDECLIYVSVILTPAWLNWLTQAIVCQGLFFQRRSYRWCFSVRLWALIQHVALMVCCSPTFLSEISKSTNKFNGFSSHLSRLFLWYQNVNRCDCSRNREWMWNYYCTGEKSICLENIHQAEMLRFRVPHLLFAAHFCESKCAPWQAPCLIMAVSWLRWDHAPISLCCFCYNV